MVATPIYPLVQYSFQLLVVGQTPTTLQAHYLQWGATLADTLWRVIAVYCSLMIKLTVFIADDSALIRERLVTLTSELQSMVIIGQAADALGALRAIRQIHPDVVILDIWMPGGNGIEVLHQLKKLKPSPKVIMFTNYAYPQYRYRCKVAGADFFFDKSTEFDQIPRALESLRHTFEVEGKAVGKR